MLRNPAKRIVLACMLALAFACARAAAPAVYAPAAVKAAFLHRFSSYVEWPDGLAASDRFIIAVFGADEVAEELDRLLPGMTIQQRPAQVRRIAVPGELAGVHILYVGPDGITRGRHVIGAATKRPILLVTDDIEGLASGSVINFLQVGRNIRFEISLPAAARAGLRIDSGLLSVAVRIDEQPRAYSRPKTLQFVQGMYRAPAHPARDRS